MTRLVAWFSAAAVAAAALVGPLAVRPAAADVKVGIAFALSGPIAVYGTPQRNGVQLAAREINARGGINGEKLVLVIEDEQGKKEEGINVFKKLIFQDKVLAIIGPTLSNSAFAADPIANAAKVPVLGVSNTASGITDIGPYVFRNSITEADILPVVIRTVKEKRGIKKVAVMYGNDDAFTKSGYEVFRQALADNKIEVLTTETFAKGDVDFSAQLTKIRSLKPDAIVVSALAEEAANIMLQARQLGIPDSVPFIGGNGFNNPKLFEIAGKAAEGTFVGGPWSIEDKSPKNVAFVKAYTEAYGQPPDQFAAQAYDGLHIVAAAIEQAKTTSDREKVREALQNLKGFVGATGPFEFKPNRDAKQDGKVFIVKGGKFTLFTD
ncbi:MAG TPA: ABC transporter substrate-binding protein [Thermodesulfobacteriota bacterium]